ncbi:hypothetical protein LZ554_005197 [Drepanopeziza brunnea f. sp. 'monogermtubi']|nr:hypothetical protein LZ554_005197 [Drepanopeziza brunnea f. sp. 'monogermtubi']
MELGALEGSEHREFTFAEFFKLYESNELLSTYYHANVRRGNSGKTWIAGLRDQAEDLKTDLEEMLRAVEEFYTTLYSEKLSDAAQRERMLSGIQKRISAGDARRIGNRATDFEVRLGLKKGNKGRSPGSDGLPIELYAKVFGGLDNAHRPYLRAVIQAIEDSTELPGWLTEGDHQYAQLPGRLIRDNIKLVQNIIEGSKQNDEGLAIVFLDQVKAYDRVSYEYLWAVLAKFGLPDSFVRRAKAVHLNSTIVPWINGVKGRPVRVRSGVRQEDPLSCVLFLICIDPLARAMNSAARITRVILPDGSQVKSALYSDDATFFIRSNAELAVFNEILHEFQMANGSLTNWSKSLLYILKDWPDRTLPEACKEAKVQNEGGYKHLGIIVGIKAGKEINEAWTALLAKMEADAVRLGKLRVSQRTRYRLATTFIMSQARHILNFQTVSAKQIEKLQKIQHQLVIGKTRSYMTKEMTYLNRNRGGLRVHNPAVIRQAQAIA